MQCHFISILYSFQEAELKQWPTTNHVRLAIMSAPDLHDTTLHLLLLATMSKLIYIYSPSIVINCTYCQLSLYIGLKLPLTSPVDGNTELQNIT